ncbi:aldose epimerase family protein [Adhaeribacter radiodurans]|uniref:Aldose 1-epimerase n=1 Tax=Adhaeribacter radiodurans TaxID=2745197 RepID=A0A7L7L1U5_9BACT|nr:aldose epimerase family protein [Adhaeribacter radiodurans]QMU26766.1 galactose mutarotase [Adhaeribacter radiodurans]
MKKEVFGKTPEGTEVNLYTLTNQNGITVQIINYGAIITSIITPDRNGQAGDVVLGFDNLKDYLAEHPYFGAVAGRCANRIAKGKFTLNGKEYTLAINNGPNHLHGGLKGFDKKVWEATEIPTQNALKLTYTSKDGEEGYPGNLTVSVTYTLTNENELKIDYEATTDKATPINLTNHSYFNLAAGQAEDVLNHEVVIYADRYTIVDEDLIPTGELPLVAGTAMDFSVPHTIGSRISQVAGNGYDHNYVLNNSQNGKLGLAAVVHEPQTDRVMEVYTTQPGVQFYSGNFLNGSLTGKGHVYKKHYGFCLETQHFPDSPNQPEFPSAILNPGETFQQSTIYKFSVQKNNLK